MRSTFQHGVGDDLGMWAILSIARTITRGPFRQGISGAAWTVLRHIAKLGPNVSRTRTTRRGRQRKFSSASSCTRLMGRQVSFRARTASGAFDERTEVIGRAWRLGFQWVKFGLSALYAQIPCKRSHSLVQNPRRTAPPCRYSPSKSGPLQRHAL